MNNDDLAKSLGVEIPNFNEQLKELVSKESVYANIPQLRPITEEPAFKRELEDKQRKDAEREEREKTRTENSTKSVEILEELVELQKEKIDILKTKIDTANHTLDLLLN